MRGHAFGRYELLSVLGRGGMGEVWRAYDSATDRIVAIKVLPAQLVADPVFVERFRREARIAATLSEPHIVPIHGYGEIDGRLYVDMRLIEGRDLQALIADGPLPQDRAVWVVGQVASALHAAHQQGLVHRDVKPSNVLVTPEDFCYLIDFGIARTVGDSGLTGTGNAIGTWSYMAPERLASNAIDSRSDVYALACVLFECLTGRPPYPGDSVESQVAAHLMHPPPEPSKVQPGVSAGFDAVIAAGMAKNPDHRYPTTLDLASAARSALTAPHPSPPPTKSRTNLLLIALVAVTVLVAATMVALVLGDSDGTADTVAEPTTTQLSTTRSATATEPTTTRATTTTTTTTTTTVSAANAPADQYGNVYVATEPDWRGITCMIEVDFVICEALTTTSWAAHGVKISTDGELEWFEGNLGLTEPTLVDDVTYRANGWLIDPKGDVISFVNESTGKGALVGPAGVSSI